MTKASPGRTSFNAGEFSELVQGRVDMDRYAASMRQMLNLVAVPQGPALRRSGTMFVAPNADENQPSAFIPFEFSDVQLSLLEFNNGFMRVLSEDGVLKDNNGSDYKITTPYFGNAVRFIRSVQSDDVLYLFCPFQEVRKLARYGTLDWRLTTVEFLNGPFMPVQDGQGTLRFSGTGSAVPQMASNNAPSGVASTNAGAADAYLAFDGQPSTQVGLSAGGWVQYEFPQPVRITGYSIGAPLGYANNQGISASDTAPYNFYLAGSNDGVNFRTLDRKFSYVDYDDGASALFSFENQAAFKLYRLVVTETRRPTVSPYLTALTLVEPRGTRGVNIRLDGAPSIGLNQGQGFLPSDVGRLLRVRSQDQRWRVLKLSEVFGPQDASAVLQGPPLGDAELTAEWQIGYFSYTLGYPTVGTFFEDRLWLSGVRGAPTLVAGSKVGEYENFETRTDSNEVLDDGALALLLKARKQSRAYWLESDERGLMVGTGSSEWVISNGGSSEPFNAKNGRARPSTERGSADVAPAKVDRQVLYVQKSKRTVREFAYVYEADGYKSPSMSLFASHLGVKRFEQMVYASEPHSIVWIRREDGSVVGLTYNREENVVGWHRHDFGGVVESMAVLPSRDGLQDTLWVSIARTINGRTRRYIERLTRFWDFDSKVADAHFVDSGLWYRGGAVVAVSGLSHLEGCDVQGLADGVPFEAKVVGGRVELRNPASLVVVGLPYETFGEIARLEAGSTDGTAQGKTKRIHNASVSVWDSAGGEIGVYNEDQREYEWSDIEYDISFEQLEPIELKTGIYGPHQVGGGYGKDGTLAFRQKKPLPLNIVAIMPQMNTQDR